MGTLGGPQGELAQRIESLTPEERRALGVLAVVARGSLSVEEVARLAEVAPSMQVLTDLERQGLARRGADDRWSLAPESVSQLKRLLAEIDTTDRVLRGFIAIAEDGRLTLQDLDAVVELTRIAAETGRWAELLQLAEAAETTLSTTQRVEAWKEIVERRLEAARVVGDTPATVRAQGELARLAARSEPALAGESSSAASAPPAGVRWALVAVGATAIAAVGLGVGYLVSDNGSGEVGAELTTATRTVTGTATGVTTPGETVTETQTETLTETVTVSVRTVTEQSVSTVVSTVTVTEVPVP